MCKQLKPSEKENVFRSALGQFTTGVAIVTAYDEQGAAIGMTINSFNSISLTPQLISWCIDRRANSYPQFSRCKKFTISILNEDQQPLAKRFATKGADKFSGIPCEPHSAPRIPSAAAWFECENYRQVSLGDHLMIVGLVREFGQRSSRPLIFSQGKFQTLPQFTLEAA